VSLPAIDDDPDPSEPTGSEIIYVEGRCRVCGEPLSGKQTYDKAACPTFPERLHWNRFEVEVDRSVLQ
jgi:hypothetical protein